MHVLTGPPHLIPRLLFGTVKTFAFGLVAPFLLVAFLATLPCVVLDFAWFRAHQIFLGNPHPKGLWEF